MHGDDDDKTNDFVSQLCDTYSFHELCIIIRGCHSCVTHTHFMNVDGEDLGVTVVWHLHCVGNAEVSPVRGTSSFD